MLKKMTYLSAAAFFAVILLGGCKTASSFEPVYAVGDVQTYKVAQETTKEVSFEQPSINQSKLDTTQSIVEVVFDQKATDAAEDGSAVFDITIKDVKLFSKGQTGVNIDYDSTREEDKDHQLSRLLGKSYKIKIADNGKASVVDASAVRAAATSREARAIVSDDSIVKRHTIKAMPQEGKAKIGRSQSWTTVGTTPEGALQPMAFEKHYSFKDYKNTDDGKIAVVEMLGIETNKPVEGFNAAGGLGVMAGIFDSSASYTGKLKYNTTTNRLVSYNEELISEHVAAEHPRGGDPDAGPDVLTMRFISIYTIEEVK